MRACVRWEGGAGGLDHGPQRVVGLLFAVKLRDITYARRVLFAARLNSSIAPHGATLLGENCILTTSVFRLYHTTLLGDSAPHAPLRAETRNRQFVAASLPVILAWYSPKIPAKWHGTGACPGVFAPLEESSSEHSHVRVSGEIRVGAQASTQTQRTN